MNRFITLFFIFTGFLANSQNIFDYEREINNKDLYIFQDIDFQNTSEHLKLSGTLISPKTDFDKIVIIVPGSGLDTRYAHFVLAEELVKNGIAVYRFDERGIGKSEGKYSELAMDLSADLGFAFQELQNTFNNKKIGIIGHSLGGIATLELLKHKHKPNFIVLIETPILKNGAFVLNQLSKDFENRIPKLMHQKKTKDEVMTFLEGYFQVVNRSDANSLKKKVMKYIKAKDFDKRFRTLLEDDFLMESISTNLEETLKEMSIKLLFLTGTEDGVMDHKKEITKVESFKNKNIQINRYEGLNHWLTDKNGAIGSSLYQMDETPLKDIIEWTLER